MRKKSPTAKIAANWANPRKSAGRKSSKRKRKSRREVLKSTFFALQLLPGEDSHKYQKLRECLIAEKKPMCVEELMLLDHIVRSHWWLRRLMRMEEAKMKNAVLGEASLAKASSKGANGTTVEENEDSPVVYEEDALSILLDHLGEMGFRTIENAIDKFMSRIEYYSSRLDELQEERKTGKRRSRED